MRHIAVTTAQLLAEETPPSLHLPSDAGCWSDECDWDSQVKIVTSVPKRRVKLASKRNRVKRQIKEAYRLNKSSFYADLEQKNTNLALFLVYIGKEKENYSFIDKKIKLLLTEIQHKL